MKKVTSNHHLNKRAIVEIIGLLLLVLLTISQWKIFQGAIEELKNSDLATVIIASSIYWLILPLAPISYRLLSDKRVNLWTTSLAQLAGSGPGRIIPGGLGRLSFSVIHLVKLGFTTSRAIIITVTSNIISVLINISVLLFLILIDPQIYEFISGQTLLPTIVVLLTLSVIFLSLYLWALHSRKTRKMTKKLKLNLKQQIKFINNNPVVFCKLIIVGLLVLSGFVAILILSSKALGIDITITNALIALSVGVFIGGILPTPGGIGGVEAGIVSTMIFIGYSATEATTVALLFRVITYWQPLLPGLIAYIHLRNKKLL